MHARRSVSALQPRTRTAQSLHFIRRRAGWHPARVAEPTGVRSAEEENRLVTMATTDVTRLRERMENGPNTIPAPKHVNQCRTKLRIGTTGSVSPGSSTVAASALPAPTEDFQKNEESSRTDTSRRLVRAARRTALTDWTEPSSCNSRGRLLPINTACKHSCYRENFWDSRAQLP